MQSNVRTQPSNSPTLSYAFNISSLYHSEISSKVDFGHF
jgi:hypothetical protein